MANPANGINPNILRWARERAGHTLDAVARVFKKDVQVIAGWESGDGVPTYVQLEKLSYQLYKRPLAIFFFPEPPDEPDQTREFRTLPEFEIANLLCDTRYAIRQACAMQLALGELNNGINPSPRKIFLDIQADPDTPVAALADAVRDYLGVSLTDQAGWKDSNDALKKWRAATQERGLFVFKRPFKQNEVSGFCLTHADFPVIYLNSGTAAARQSFTLFHELAHILLRTSSVTKQSDRYIASLTGRARKTEVFANQFAAECLVPSADFEQWAQPNRYDDESLQALVNRYHVSPEMLLRKFLDRDWVDRVSYETKADAWNKPTYKRSSQAKKAGVQTTTERRRHTWGINIWRLRLAGTTRDVTAWSSLRIISI
jgi:Zn-dependent peptidase ImmA (M78 family)